MIRSGLWKLQVKNQGAGGAGSFHGPWGDSLLFQTALPGSWMGVFAPYFLTSPSLSAYFCIQISPSYENTSH